MRVIQTNYYFTAKQLGFPAGKARGLIKFPRQYGVSVMWFKTNTNRRINISEIVDSDTGHGFCFRLGVRNPSMSNTEEQFEHDFLDFLFLSASSTTRGEWDEFNSEPQRRETERRLNQHRDGVVNEIYSGGFVVERSPPDIMTFQALIRNASPLGLGTFTGTVAVSGHPWLMMFSIPMGIILVGAAAGVSRGLAEGLHWRIVKAISDPDKNSDDHITPRDRRATSSSVRLSGAKGNPKPQEHPKSKVISSRKDG